MDVVNILVFFMFSMFQGVKTYSKHQIRADREIVAKDGQFPFQTLVRLKYGNRYPLCNGVILNADYVLTTAGCIKHYLTSVNDLEVVVGGLSANMTPSSNHVQESFVKNIFVRPTWYITDGNSADIALLQVYPQFRETPYVRWAKIGNMMKSPPSTVIISGWGNADKLVYIRGQTYNENTCNRLLEDKISSSSFCIGNVTSTKLLLIKMHAGAGVGIGSTIYGILSSSNNAVATILSQYHTWIESVIYRYPDDETTENSNEADYDYEESDETMKPTSQTTRDFSNIYSTGRWRPSTLTRYTTPKYSRTNRTTISTSTTPTDEQTSDESDETDETDESEENNAHSTHYSSPLPYSTISRTAKHSTSISTTSFDEKTSEVSNETDKTEETDQSDENDERSTQYNTPKYSAVSRITHSKPSSPISTTSFDEQSSEESTETDETEESDNETERSTLYTMSQYPNPYRTTPSRLPTDQSTTTFVEETSAESDEAERSTQLESNKTGGTERLPTQYTLDVEHHSTGRTNPLGLSTSYKPTTINNESEETEPSNNTNEIDEEQEVKKTDEILVMDLNSTTVANEYHNNNASDNSHSEPISSKSVKFIPPYFTYSTLLCYLHFLTKNLL